MQSKNSQKILSPREKADFNGLILLAVRGDVEALDHMARLISKLDRKGYGSALREYIGIYDELRRERRKISRLGYEDATLSLNQPAAKSDI